jgi:hypothetical protein
MAEVLTDKGAACLPGPNICPRVCARTDYPNYMREWLHAATEGIC